ncbi:MAG: NAD-dependent epimerase/dehydratase family protein [Mariniphaga sp.]|nr:NAD-dependent epimerase/dehydratase family protein [Mariniphaga sp.]
MRCLVTGATGFIGNRLVQELLNRKMQVHVLVRSKNKLPADIREKVTVFCGDITNQAAVDSATKNCESIFHLAGFAGIWSKDKTIPFRTNVEGTKNILETALRNNIQKVVFTSSAATFSSSAQGELIDENYPLPDTYFTEYEQTKREAEQICLDYCTKGVDTVIVNPTRVFGPGLLNKSNSVSILIKNYMKGTWRIIPGDGNQIGNYVFIDDVVNGHILALERGIPGEKYILGGTNISYNKFFDTIAEVGDKKYKLFHLPHPVMYAFSKFELFCAETFGKPPLITPPWVKRYNQNRPVSSQKAIEDLSYSVTPLPEGIEKTILWLNSNKKINGKNIS